MKHKDMVCDAIAASRALAKDIARAAVAAEKTGDKRLGLAIDRVVAQHGVLCANLRELVCAACDDGLVDDGVVALASEPKDGGRR